MSTSQGRDKVEEEMQQVAASALTSTSTSDGNSCGALSAFTPVNANRASIEFISPLTTPQETRVGQDIPEEPALKRRKGGAAQANKGRAVSIAQVWQYRDEGDVVAHNAGADFQASFPKRKKSAPAKRSKAAPGQSEKLDQVCGQDGPTSSSMQDSEYRGQQQGSRMITRPDSGTRLTKRAVSLKAQNPKFKPGPFRNSVITKPSVSREGYGLVTKPVTILQGWTSTEETMKSLSNGISKTTLDRLTAFRFRPTAALPSPGHSLPQSDHVPGNESEELYVGAPFSPPSIDDGPIPSYDSIFDTYHQMDQENEPIVVPQGTQVEQSQKPIWGNETGGHANFCNSASWDIRSSRAADDMYLLKPHGTPVPINCTPSKLLQNEEASRLFPLVANVGLEIPQHASDFGEPSSSGFQALTGLEDEAHGIHHNNRLLTDALLPEHSNPEEAQDTDGCGIKHNSDDPAKVQVDVAGFSSIEADDPAEVPAYRKTFDDNQPVSRHLADLEQVQVEESDADDCEMVQRGGPNDYDFDEFGGDELDDADLLAITSDQAMPETRPEAEIKNSCGGLGTSGFHASVPVHAPSTGSRQDQPTIPKTLPEIIDLDDEYPLEEGLEEEDMISLPEHFNGVVESFQAPPSLQFPFSDDSISGEVYDRSLQFSPPKKRPLSASPGKPADGSSTNANSPSKAGNTDLVPGAMYEEDWSFIRSNNVDDSNAPPISDRATERHSAVSAGQVIKRIISLGPQKRRLPSTPTKTQQATQKSILGLTIDDSRDFEPLKPFARPAFPDTVADRCPITGVSPQSILRVCFRVGEMFKEGARCDALKQDVVIELFAKVTFSSREQGTTKQHFQFADLWHDRPPFPNGILPNYKGTELAESESRVFVDAGKHMMARCIGRLKRDKKMVTGWLLDIINIRPTDWEEIKWTKRIVSAGLVKSEKMGV
ncbi:uncharacterized protein L3040_001651 [Drepanopeziza brunnea f. sp. 'multigermtubi']|uniref:uncharacterized protein n=1 Tax=Drepanopeziza brunnea f. sp. 'multigermtubi' TaxID=698441 RepID=UPI0023A4C066|nr:hypothetical protein L3040_001651 [Drepanopeziza brunnea f. sp. 'multigermtubi']